jgi:hypothetical protein
MKYIITYPQLSSFLKRRFTPDELAQMVESVKGQLEDGESVSTAVYDTIRHYVSLKDFQDIVDSGTEQEYWDSYLTYEIPLVLFIKASLDL